MRLIAYHGPDGIIGAVVREERAIDLTDLNTSSSVPIPESIDGIIGADPSVQTAIDAALDTIPSDAGRRLSELTLAPPFMPRIIICGGANFADHLDETHRAKPDHVEFFLKSPTSIIGAGQDVRMDPALSQKYDYEVELAVIIGRTARDVPIERAFDHVFGYTIINDVSIRDQQVIRGIPSAISSGSERASRIKTPLPSGRWILTKDALPDVSGLALRTRVAGVLRQNNSMRNIIWDVPSLISYYSTYMTLEPGFLIACGTPGGPALGSDVELGADPYERSDGVERGAYVPDGALVECEIEGIGTLSNRYVIAR